jgi:hypothetical protein
MVIPCYNEEEVLPETARRLREKLTALQALMQHYHCPDLPFEPEMVEHTTVLALDVAAMTGKRRTSF